MNNQDNYTGLIERYLDGEMSHEELAAFEAELLVNNALREELEFYQFSNSVIVENKLADVKGVIREVAAEYSGRNNADLLRRGGIIGGGLALILIAFIVFSGKNYFRQEQGEKMLKGSEKHVSQTDSLPETLPERTLASDSPEVSKNSPVTVNNVQRKNAPAHKTFFPGDTLSESDTSAVIQKTESAIAGSDAGNVGENSANTDPYGIDTGHGAAVKEPLPEPDKCVNVTITAGSDVKHTCTGRNEGRIRMTNVKGGTAPYHFQLSSGEENETGIFSDLGAGFYSVRVRDSHQCEFVQHIELRAERCRLDLYLDPVSGRPVVLPEYGKAGVLTIFDKQGNLRLEKRIFENQQYEWYGEGNTGSLAPGYYLFIINYEDGAVQNGSITVMP